MGLSYSGCKWLLSDRRHACYRSSPCIHFAKRQLIRFSRRRGKAETLLQASDLKPIMVWPEPKPEPKPKPKPGSLLGRQPAMISPVDEIEGRAQRIIRIAGRMLQNWVDGGGRTVTPEMSLGLKGRRKPVTLWRGCREYGFASYEAWCEASRSAHPVAVEAEVPALRARPVYVDRIDQPGKAAGTWLF